MLKRRIVTIHSVNDAYYSPARLVKYINIMRKLGWEFVSMEKMFSTSNNKGKLICLTLDDAYKTCITHCLPILEKYNVPALVFIPTGLLGFEADTPELLNHSCYPHEATMDVNDINEWLSKGYQIGFHTHKHINLHIADNESIKKDFECGMDVMAKNNWETRYFAYPFGFLPKDRTYFENLLKGYNINAAFTINWGDVDTNNPLFINRVCLGNKENFWWSVIKTIGWADIYFETKKMSKEQVL